MATARDISKILTLEKYALRGGDRFPLEVCKDSVSGGVTENLHARHLKPLFLNGA